MSSPPAEPAAAQEPRGVKDPRVLVEGHRTTSDQLGDADRRRVLPGGDDADRDVAISVTPRGRRSASITTRAPTFCVAIR
jgi:hypothetical protein